MKKLTAEKCCQLLDSLNSNGMSILEGYYCEALEIALPILEQQERGEGDWIEWRGGKNPVSNDREITIKMRDGTIMSETHSDCWNWIHDGHDSDDIIAYRIIPERATNQNGEQ